MGLIFCEPQHQLCQGSDISVCFSSPAPRWPPSSTYLDLRSLGWPSCPISTFPPRSVTTQEAPPQPWSSLDGPYHLWLPWTLRSPLNNLFLICIAGLPVLCFLTRLSRDAPISSKCLAEEWDPRWIWPCWLARGLDLRFSIRLGFCQPCRWQHLLYGLLWFFWPWC